LIERLEPSAALEPLEQLKPESNVLQRFERFEPCGFKDWNEVKAVEPLKLLEHWLR
jgi:hypothetical protein